MGFEAQWAAHKIAKYPSFVCKSNSEVTTAVMIAIAFPPIQSLAHKDQSLEQETLKIAQGFPITRRD